MTDFLNRQISAPANWEEFEDLCADLWEIKWQDPKTQRNGRSGQKQKGVDVFGRIGGNGDLVAVQCKGKDSRYGGFVTEDELADEVTKAMAFRPKLSGFILATSAADDAGIQEYARKLSEANRQQGLFTVDVVGWGQIQRWLANYPLLMDKYYPSQGPTQLRTEQKLDELVEGQREGAQAQISMQAMLGELLDRAGGGTPIKAFDLEGESIETGGSIEWAGVTEEIDGYRDIISSKPMTALKLLEGLKQRAWSNVSQQQKFRIVTNIGACQLRLGEKNSAIESFRDAEQLAPDEPKAICNVAHAQILNEEFDSALDSVKRAFLISPADSYSHSVFVTATSRIDVGQTFEDLVPSEMHENSEVCYSIGQAYWFSGRRLQAYHWLKRAYTLDPESEDCQEAFGSIVIDLILGDKESAGGSGEIGELTESIQDAMELLIELWRRVSYSEASFRYANLGKVLSNTYRRMGDFASAKKISDRVVELTPDDPECQRLAAWNALGLNLYKDARACLGHPVLNDDLESRLLTVEILIKEQLFFEAEEVLEGLNPTDLKGKFKSLAASLDARLKFENQSPEEGFSCLAKYIEDTPDDIIALLTGAELLGRMERDSDALAYLRTATKALEDGSSDGVEIAVADALYEAGAFVEAQKIYLKYSDNRMDSREKRRLLACFYNTDQRKVLTEALAQLPENERRKVYYRRLAFALKARIGEMADAKSELELILSENEEDLEMRLHWLQLKARGGEIAATQEFLSGCANYTDEQPELRIGLAHQMVWSGLSEKGLKLAYDVLRRTPESYIAHLGYIGLIMLGKIGDQLLGASTVAEDTAFSVRDSDGQEKTYIIEGAADGPLREGEIPPTHRLSVAVMGKKVGDSIQLDVNPFQEEEFTITSVQSKYLYVFHKTGKEYSAKFPERKDFFNIKLKEKEDGTLDPAPILRSVDERSAWAGEVLDLYSAGSCPVAFMSKLLGSHPLEVWPSLRGAGGHGVTCCVGTHAERLAAMQLIDHEPAGIVIDPLTLFTVVTNGLQNVLQSVFPEVGIVQSTLNLYEGHIEMLRVAPQRGSMSKTADGYSMTELSDADIQGLIRGYQEVLDWAQKNCEILPALGKEDYKPVDLNYADLMDVSFLDTILAANGSGYILLSEDMYFRMLARQILEVDGVWLQPILISAKKSDLISVEEYCLFVVKLIEEKSEFITIDTEGMCLLASLDDWEVSERVKSMMATLGGDKIEFTSSMAVAIEFLVSIWKGGPSEMKAEMLTYAILNSLHSWKAIGARPIVELFENSQLVNRLPVHLRPSYLMVIRKWRSGHFLT